MPLVTVKNLHSKTIHCKSKTEKLLSILLDEVDWMHACGGKGRCTTCSVEILDGKTSLGPVTEAEERFIKLGKISSDTRLACQATVCGDVTIQVPDQYKLPHQDYSN